MLPPDRRRAGNRRPVNGVPAYTLFGEVDGPLAPFHVETIAARAPGNGWHIPIHRHPALAQFLLIANGKLAVHLDGERSTVASPALLFVPAGRTHGFEFRPATEGFVLSLLDRQGATGLPMPSVHMPQQPIVARCDTSAIRAAARLHALRDRPGAGARAMCRALLAQIGAHALMLLEAQGGQSGARRYRRLSNAFESAIEQRLLERWSVADHAAALSVSPAHLNRVVRQLYGMTASALIARATLRRAQTLLMHTDRSVAQIAFTLGFEDPPHFSRRFRVLAGQSPSAWRRSATGPDA